MIELTTEELKLRFSDNIFGRISETADELGLECLSLIHISEPTRQEAISYAVFCLKKKNTLFYI